MTALRDPFAITHKKDIKNKAGEVVAQVDYVGWSQAADRLDEAASGQWSFSIMAIGEDWVHGRLTIADQHFENIGYAENADAAWKKEALKDATSDAFKRCAALAGVARYLYDKDAPQRPQNGHIAPTPRPAPVRSSTAIPDDLDDLAWEDLSLARTRPTAVALAEPVDAEGYCPEHDLAWTLKPGGVSKKTGKPYDAFYSCPASGPPYCNAKPTQRWITAHHP